MNIGRRIGSVDVKRYGFILAAIIVFAFFIRIYHIGFPAIGYHNVKEHEMINIAKNMLKNGDFFSRYADFHYGLEIDHKKVDMFPGGYITIWQTALCFKLFGPDAFLAPARIINVIFFLIGILFAFNIVVFLTQSRPLGLLSAFILSILPLGIFFARNLQPDCPAFAGMLGCIYFYLRFVATLEFKYLFFSIICAVFIFLCKMTFLICFLPLLFIIPYRKLLDRYHPLKLARNIFLTLLPLIAVTAIFWMSGELVFRTSIGRINFLALFTFSYWGKYGRDILIYTVKENWTIVFTIVGILGYFMAVRNRQNALLRRFVFGWMVTLIAYCMVLSDYINQHNYYQMPFLFMAAFLNAYALYFIGGRINQLTRRVHFANAFFGGLISHAGTVIVILLFIINAPPIYEQAREHYATLFGGMDDIGDYICRHTKPGDRFFLNSFCQQWGICTYAERKCGWVNTLEEFKEKEKIFGVRFIVLYRTPGYDLNISPDVGKYIYDNYRLVYLGFTSVYSNKNGFLAAMVLQKGGTFDYDIFVKSRIPLLKKEYRACGITEFYKVIKDG